MAITIVDKFKSNIKRIDKLFDLPNTLREIYANALTEMFNDLKTNTTKQIAENSKTTLQTIHQKHLRLSKSELSTLYSQGLVLVVSNAESILKEAFSTLLIGNIDNKEKLSELDKKMIPFSEIRKREFNITQRDWAQLLLDLLWTTKNAEQRPNFQNIDTVIGLFKGYFQLDLKLDESLRRYLILFFQFRHIIVHNASKVDSNLIHELKRAEIDLPLTVGEEVVVTDYIYKKAKESFIKFLEILQKEVEEKKLNYPISQEISIEDIPF